MFTASLYAAKSLTHNVKYRKKGSIEWDLIVTTTNVNNSNFSNFNIFADNAVELNCSTMTLPPVVVTTPSYDNAIVATHIKIDYLGFSIVGYITDVEYINDNSSRIYYAIDAFTSAIESGLIDEMGGICQRANLTCDDIFANLQPEPFSPSDISQANSELTNGFNQVVSTIEGVAPGSGGVSTSGTKFILTVSRVIAEYCQAGPFGNPSVQGGLKEVQDLYFEGSETTVHAGGVFRGIPYVFDSLTAVTDFILDITTGCGFIAKFDPKGYDKQDAVYRRWQAINKHGYVQGDKNWNNDPVESTLVIDQSDIYALYCIPANFAKATPNYIVDHNTIDGFRDLSTMHKLGVGAESVEKGKLLAFPYCYNRLVTANGDMVDIIPQTMYNEANEFNPNFSITFFMRFIGGDTPRLMGRIAMTRDPLGSTPYASDTVVEWFTIRNYPAITLSVNNSYNTQFMRDLSNSRQLSAASTNAISANETSYTEAAQRAFIDTVKGKHSTRPNENASTGQRFMTGLGQLGGYISERLLAHTGIDTTNMLSDDVEIERIANTRKLSAGNIFSSSAGSGTRMGNDFLSQYGLPAISIYDCGATDTELFTYCRFLEEFGSALNTHINPITNDGNIFGGRGVITEYNGKTYYKFANMITTGKMPIQWKERINTLFTAGVYLIGKV